MRLPSWRGLARPAPDRRSSATTSTDAAVHDPAASMSLIFDAMKHPIDPGYENAAKRRAAAGDAGRSRGRLLLTVTALVIGLLLSVGATTLRVPKKVAADRRHQLVQQVQDRQAANDADTDEVARLRREVSQEQSSALSRTSKKPLSRELTVGETTAGTAPMTGSGWNLRLDNPKSQDPDAADNDPRTGGGGETITSADLQQIVNAYWQAGARGIAINDQRITSLTAIRFAGSAVLVNFRPLTTPYVVHVVGPSGVDVKFRSGYGGQYLDGMRKSGFSVNSAAASSITLPAVPAVRIEKATVVP